MRVRDLKTTAELVPIYRFKNAECCRKWLVRHQVPYMRRGRVILVDTFDMDKACSKAWDKQVVRLLA